MRRVFSAPQATAVRGGLRAYTHAGILTGVQRILGSRPSMPFDARAIKSATEEFVSMGFDGAYDKNFGHEEIANHVYGYLCAKSSDTKGQGNLRFQHISDKHAYFFCAVDHDVETMTSIEKWAHARRELFNDHAISIRSFTGTTRSGKEAVLYDCRFLPFVDPSGKGTKLEDLSSVDFATKRTKGAVGRYRDILKKMEGAIAPVYNIQTLAKSGNVVINVGVRNQDNSMSLDELSSLVSCIPEAKIVKKFVESFSNGTQVYSVYVRGATEAAVADAVTMIGVLPNRPGHPYNRAYLEKKITAKEAVYAFAVSQFAYYFAKPESEGNYQALYKALEKDTVLLKRLKTLRNSLFQELMDEASISQVVTHNIPLFKRLFADFEKGATPESAKLLADEIDKELPPQTLPEFNALFKAFNTFNTAVKATNFYKTNRAAVAYRLDPSFLGHLDFPRVPYAVYMIVGAYFRGFHVRFHDISRGGVRMMLSRSNAEYKGKRKTLFQENYNLAYTQMLKNKDIPESGSKGTLLVSPRFDHKKHDTEVLFLQYVDALLDIMIPSVPGVRNDLPKRELLFLGPDENTAGDYPSHAAKWAKNRGFPEWKSLTTGKSSWDGGIPHDVFGMTTTSVREYLLEAYKEYNLKQEDLVKFQTGGPDGDLGSNEIVMGREKQKAMCDISGCLYDPNGLNRQELVRLANERVRLEHFDTSKLGAGGFFLPSTAPKTTLPDGNVYSGGELLSQFHLSKYADADVFVPCGGRPNSITIDNVHLVLKDMPGVTGQMMIDNVVGNVMTANLKWKIISEGANLFITPEARIALENVGVMLWKDSSANKGGVTSSSIEVYTGLAMADDEFVQQMCCDARKPTEMYDRVVKEIIARLRENARLEYKAIQKDVAHKAFGGHRQSIADAYSTKMVEIYEFVSRSNLAQDEALFRYVLTQYTPKALLEQVPLDVILKRVPRNYLEAIFHKQIAIQYIYTAGASANEFSFFEYMRELTAKANAFVSKSE